MPHQPERASHLLVPGDMSPAQVAALLARARSLQGPAGAAGQVPPLRGKYLALLCEADDSDSAIAFRHAAMDLGARVATIRPKLTVHSHPDEVQHTARVLGRLYDAVECQGMAEPLVSAIARNAGIPVFDGLACDGHPVAALAPLLGIDAPLPRQRTLLLQAALLTAMA